MTLESMSEAWRAASADLGVRLEAPARIVIDGTSTDCVAFMPDFGSVNGMAAFSRSATPIEPARNEAGPSFSMLDDRSYAQFDRDLFIATLNDWGWFGPGEPPDWYTGAPWSK